MSVRHKIDKYKISIYGNDRIGESFRSATKIIELYSDDANVATAYFSGRGQTLFEDSFSLNHIIFTAPEEQYAHVVDLLRNENPVFINWIPHPDSKEQNDGDAFFDTGRENIGELDLSQPREVPDPSGISRQVQTKTR